MKEKNLGILYICTGAYKVFWEAFYNSFEEKFLCEYEKHYYVFTDCEEMFLKNNNDRVHWYLIDNQPWPLITLLRFGTFLKQEENLKKHQFLIFSNANIVCNDYVSPDEILPNCEKGEKLFFTKHPGYYKNKPWNTPLDRNRKSLAYVPFQCGSVYVIGAFFGGYTEDFMKMTHVLHERICEDLKRGVIAKWHDESHINHYILQRNDIRIISPEYCYPVGIEIEGKKKIAAVSKADKFDVNRFKGFYNDTNVSRRDIVINSITQKCRPFIIFLLVIRDFLLRREKAK